MSGVSDVFTDELLDQYREHQAAAAQYGLTPFVMDLDLKLKSKLCRELQLEDPFTQLEHPRP